MSSLKDLLKDEVFGVMSDGKKFVVSGDLIVYTNGGYDRVSQISDDLSFISGYYVKKLYKCCSFYDFNLTLKYGSSDDLIYDRNKSFELFYKTAYEMSIESIKEQLNIKNLKIVDKDSDKTNLKSLLKNGVFGILSDGSKFVVVNDFMVYEDGMFDDIDNLNDDLSFEFDKIMKLKVGCKCFNSVNKPDIVGDTIIYSRDTFPVEMTVEEIKKKLGITNLKIVGGK